MRKTLITLACGLLAGAAQAGPYSDDMAKCLVSSTSARDKTDLVRWIFANAALHPQVADISNASAEARDTMNRAAAALLERLLTDSCRRQTDEAVRYEGPTAIQQSFQVLGQVAMQELMTHPAVATGFGDFGKYLDRAKLDAIGKR